MRKNVEFVNKVVKQGNSLCVRIPHTVKKELGLEEGTEVLVTLVPQERLYKYDEKIVPHILSVARKIKGLNKYNELKQRLFILLNFEFLAETTAKDANEQKKKQLEFIKKKKREFGTRLIDEFIDWGMSFNKEAFITEKDGALILKPQYRYNR